MKLVFTIIGHVNHGKSTVMEYLCGIKFLEEEAGLITQCLKIVELNTSSIKSLLQTSTLYQKLKINVNECIFIDTPGHGYFVSIKQLGIKIADICIFVIDINKGLQSESMALLSMMRNIKTAKFVILFTKFDLFKDVNNVKFHLIQICQPLWNEGYDVVYYKELKSINTQIPYFIVGRNMMSDLHELIAYSLFKFKPLEDSKCVYLDYLNEEKLHILLLKNYPLEKSQKIANNKIKHLYLHPYAKKEKVEKLKKDTYIVGIIFTKPANFVVGQQLSEIEQTYNIQGIGVKADTPGKLDAITKVLSHDYHIPIMFSTVGNISKKDILRVNSNSKQEYRFVLGYNVKTNIQTNNIILNDVIYNLVDSYVEKYTTIKKENYELLTKNRIVIQFLSEWLIKHTENFVIVGIKIIEGTLKQNVILYNDYRIGEVVSIQSNNVTLKQSKANSEVCIKINGNIDVEKLFKGYATDEHTFFTVKNIISEVNYLPNNLQQYIRTWYK